MSLGAGAAAGVRATKISARSTPRGRLLRQTGRACAVEQAIVVLRIQSQQLLNACEQRCIMRYVLLEPRFPLLHGLVESLQKDALKLRWGMLFTLGRSLRLHPTSVASACEAAQPQTASACERFAQNSR